MALSVKINGADRAAADSYSIKPGDTVEVGASVNATWTSSGDKIQLVNPSSTGALWRARLINTQTSDSVLALAASSGSAASQNKSIRFNVAPADARNGSYRIYSTGGPRAALDLNFDIKSYKLSGSNVEDPDQSGSFHEDASEPSTFVFDNTRAGADAHGARFRISKDAVVGAYPLPRLSDPQTYPVTPFIGSRAWVTPSHYTQLRVDSRPPESIEEASTA